MPPHHLEVMSCSPTSPSLPHVLGLSVLREPDPPLGTQLPSDSGFQLLCMLISMGRRKENQSWARLWAWAQLS